ncbi:hypothetical protein LZ30DRAFT_782665 [Colletotrichum cereale]|nr:hypothetical protein LZ30DRAFT_782665 [Colletotrichum cereale]
MFFIAYQGALFIPPPTIDPLLLVHQYQVCGLDARAFDYGLIQEADHGRFHFRHTDLSGPNTRDNGVYAAIAAFGGRIDLLANVAGVMDSFSSVDSVTDAE